MKKVTGLFFTIALGGLQVVKFPRALKCIFEKEDGDGDVSSFATLCTTLAACIGTGSIVGVATALRIGGPGALFWMWVSAILGMTTKYAEGLLAIKYRTTDENGEIAGGPMYYIQNGLGDKFKWLAKSFAFFGAVTALLGSGTFPQVHAITESVSTSFHLPVLLVGAIITIMTAVVTLGGIKSISKVSAVVVPTMAIFYVICGLIVIIGNISNLPSGLAMIFKMAFSVKAVGGGLCGSIVASMMNAMRFGVARGVFSNEAGMGSAAITAAAATTDNPVRQGYINMTGTFWDTIVVCTITGLAIASSGVLGTTNAAGELLTGSDVTIAAFETVLGSAGGWLVTIGITLFAFSTILGWEYHGEKAFEYLFGTHKYNMVYRIIFSLVVYIGCTQTLSLVWSFSDIANALMAIPNLICMLLLSGESAKDVKEFKPEI